MRLKVSVSWPTSSFDVTGKRLDEAPARHLAGGLLEPSNAPRQRAQQPGSRR